MDHLLIGLRSGKRITKIIFTNVTNQLIQKLSPNYESQKVKQGNSQSY